VQTGKIVKLGTLFYNSFMSFEQSSAKFESIQQRNIRIAADLDAGMLPILPFELSILERQLNAIKNEQDEMGKELGEVNHQSSETWHDNFAANQIEWHSKVVSARGRRIVETIHRVVEHSFPPEGDEVTLGSVIKLRFKDSAPVEDAILTGTARELETSTELGLPDDLLFVSLQSPIGRSLLGARPGDIVPYDVNGSPRTVELISVQQLRPLE